MPYVVKYVESEQGWRTETWFIGYDTEEEALSEEKKVNDKNTAKTAPRIYTVAHYKGMMDEVPKSYEN